MSISVNIGQDSLEHGSTNQPERSEEILPETQRPPVLSQDPLKSWDPSFIAKLESTIQSLDMEEVSHFKN